MLVLYSSQAMYSNPWPITPPETPDYKPSSRVIGDEKLEACTSSKRFLEFASPKVQFVLRDSFLVW